MTILALALVPLACIDDGRSPVGVDLLPGGILEGGLRVIPLTDFDRAEDFDVFPAGRGTAERLVSAHGWPIEPGIESRVLVRFPLSSIDTLPAGSQIIGSDLRLVFLAVDRPVTFRLHRVTSAWSEEAATWQRRDFGSDWASPGGDFDPAPVSVFTIEPSEPDTTGADSLSVADSIRIPFPEPLVEAWRSGTMPNEGLILVQETPGTEVVFPSHDGVVGSNPLGPRLDVEVQLEEPGSPAFLQRIVADEDTFIVEDTGGFSPGDLTVSAGDPVRHVVLVPSLGGVPAGATIVEARLVVSVDESRIPDDSLSISANQVLGEFRGETTILGSTLGVATLQPDGPADSLVFESGSLTARVREWLRDPASNEGIILSVRNEETSFGGVSLFAPDAELPLRPRLRLVIFPPPPLPAPAAHVRGTDSP